VIPLPGSNTLAGQLPMRVPLHAATWDSAAVLAGFRIATNDASRRADRDQGLAGNQRNDVIGAMAELVGRLVAEKYLALGVVAGTWLDLAGHVNEVDLTFRDAAGGQHLLEVKGHLRQRNYTRFAINKRAHARSVKREATGYLGVLTRLGGGEAIVSQLIPVADVARWREVTLNSVPQDPALVMRLDDFRAQYAAGLDPATRFVSTEERLAAVIEQAHSSLDEGRMDVLLPTASAVEAVAWAIGHVSRWERIGAVTASVRPS